MRCSADATLQDAVLPPGFCAFELPLSINQVRSLVSLGPTNFLTIERRTSSIIYAYRKSETANWADTRFALVVLEGLNHGLAYRDGYVYASSDEKVYRWKWKEQEDGSTVLGSDLKEVIVNINRDGNGGAPFGHTTRTLAFDETGVLYVSVGSAGNVDQDSFRSRIRRFDVADDDHFPLDFIQGEVFADGLRNEVGMAFDRHGDLWGVENGADDLFRSDLGGDIHNDNPGEELNRFREEDAGKHWGYPYCWTEFRLDEPHAMGRGTAWAWPDFLDEYSDSQCRADFMEPELVMQAHTAPLGIVFYEYISVDQRPAECPPDAAFPESMDGYAFIALHGSWNRDIPVGYSVVYVEMDGNGNPVGEPVDLLAHKPPSARWGDGFRPVDVDFDACGRLLVSSDGTRGFGYGGSKIVRIESMYDKEAAATEVSYAPSNAPLVIASEAPSDGKLLTAASGMPSISPIADLTPSVSSVSTNHGAAESSSATAQVFCLVVTASWLVLGLLGC